MTGHLSDWAEQLRHDHAVILAASALDRVEEIEQQAVEEHVLPLQGLAILLCRRITIDARHGCEALIEEYVAHPAMESVEGEAELADLYTTGVGTTLLKAAADLEDLSATLLGFEHSFGLRHILPILQALHARCPEDASEEDKAALVQALLTPKSDQGISRIARALRGDDLEDPE